MVNLPLGYAAVDGGVKDERVESDEQEGLYLLGNLPRDEGTIARIGDRVTMFFEPVADELRLPQFRLAGDGR